MLRILTLLVSLYAVNTFAVEAPNFEIKTPQYAGQLSDLKGKVVYLDFWASWCGPCRRSFPWLNDMLTQYEKQGLVVITVNVDKERQLAETFLSEVPALFPVVFNPSGSIAKKYDILGMPSSFLIDRNGQIHAVHTGFFKKKIKFYENEIVALLKEQVKP